MKKLFFISFVLTLICLSFNTNKCYAQIDSSIYNKLSPEAKKELSNAIQSTKISKQLDDYVEWTGKGEEIGKAVGNAVNSSLSAITENAEKFANTKVGKFTMFIVAYKVLGKDFIRLIIGIPLIICFLIFLITYIYKNFIPKKILIKKTGEDKDKIKEYCVLPDFQKMNSSVQNQYWLHLFSTAVFSIIIILSAIAFFIP